MGTRRILVVLLGVLTTGLLPTSTAHAGGWAETVLDPTPSRIESSVTYTFGGAVGLVATDADGAAVVFPATPTVTDGHYVAEVVFPHDGVWHLGADHSMLMPDESVAVVTVPGPVSITPSEVVQRARHTWGTVRPSFPPPAEDAAVVAPTPPDQEPVEALVEPRGEPQVERRDQEPAAAAVSEEAAGPPIEMLLAGGFVAVALAAWLGRRRLGIGRRDGAGPR